ncbi:glycosyltransferase family 2 protein [Xanthobacter sp. KR7-225]|uniref:glycosyltransferase family 2 protein n=1 Tax=Xanthobacter sp. KR7-225 TaxID=3156613 RepID=UPI0032B59C6B
MEQAAQLSSAAGVYSRLRIAVLIPCYNEAATVGKVIADFRTFLPAAEIYVYDNNSTDYTSKIATAAGAIVRKELRQGKGYVVRRMFSDIDADIYLLVDGDATYDASAAPKLIETMLDGPFDKVNGVRVPSGRAAFRKGHVLGNVMLTTLVAYVFDTSSKDMLSGYKVLSRRFVKTFPSSSSGFEIETELLVHALELDISMADVDTPYYERPAGSVSKLSTFRDGWRILWMIVHLIRDFLPFRFFLGVAALFFILSLAFGTPVLFEYFETGLVPRLPTAVGALGLMILAFLSLFAGLILDSVARGRREMKLLAFLQFPTVHLP